MDASNFDTIAFNCVTLNDTLTLRLICKLAQKNEYDLEQVDNFGNTVLLKACYLGRLVATEILLESGANIKAMNFFGQNALTLAANKGNVLLVRILLSYRSYADFNLASITPAFCIATLRQHKSLIAFFLSLDGNHSLRDDIITAHGLTPEDIQRFLKIKKEKQEIKSIKH